MREYNYPLAKQIFGGLRRYSNGPRRGNGLIECHNIGPVESGYEVHEELVSLNASASWGGLGKKGECSVTRTIVLNVNDFITDLDINNVSVYIDGVLKGTTDANGDITITNILVGGHTVKLYASGYTDSEDDILANDYIRVI